MIETLLMTARCLAISLKDIVQTPSFNTIIFSQLHCLKDKEMASKHLILLPLMLLLLPSLLTAIVTANPAASYSDKTTNIAKEIVIEGMVMCQSCKQAGTWSLTGAKPMPSAKVSISCKDYKNRVKYYQAFKADAGGYFYAPLHGLNIKNFYLGHPLRACTVRLLSSSNPTCNLFTNINGGIEGATLKDKNKKVSGPYYEAVVYSAWPLAFRPAHCLPHIHY